MFAEECHRRTVQRAAMLEVGILPVDGGWDDQTALFQQASGLALREKNEIAEARRRSETLKHGS